MTEMDHDHEHTEDLKLVQSRLQLQAALCRQDRDALPELIEQILAQEAGLTGEALQQLLCELAYFGYAGLAAELAVAIEAQLGPSLQEQDEVLAFALEQHQVFAAIENDWRHPPADNSAFLAALQIADIEDPEDLAVLLDLRDAPAQTQMGRLKQRLRERKLDEGLLSAQMAFGRHMLETYGTPLFTSAAMLEQAFGLWQLAPEKGRPEFDKWFKIKAEDFDAWCQELAQEEPLDAFVLLWGLPHVCDWLLSQNLIQILTQRHIMELLPSIRQHLMQTQGDSLWTYGFVAGWPRPQSVSAEEFEAEASKFAFEQTSL